MPSCLQFTQGLQIKRPLGPQKTKYVTKSKRGYFSNFQPTSLLSKIIVFKFNYKKFLTLWKTTQTRRDLTIKIYDREI